MGNTAPNETFAAGIPVEVGGVERELKKLWHDGGERMCRASLINLAVYSEAPDSLAQNTQLIGQITEEHACRAIVIGANPAAAENAIEAWIGAHCHVSRAGVKQICSEQLSFSLRGAAAQLLPQILVAHLDSDLPLHLWWQGEFHDPIDAQLWSWVDRLIYDSKSWRDFDAQMRLVEAAQEEAKQRVVLCDLNWTRLVQFRLAVAQFFDAPTAQRQLEAIRRVEIDFGAGFRSTAVLLAGWLAAQLGWTARQPRGENELKFTARDDAEISVVTNETAGDAISRCALFAGDTAFRVTRAPSADLLETRAFSGAADGMRQLMPASRDTDAELMSEELMRGGPHRVYLRTVNAVRTAL